MKFGDLFCGAGGLSAGLINAGMFPIYACDAWQPALDVYRRNLSLYANRADLSEPTPVIRRLIKLAPDLIAGGPPCTEVSSAGKRIEGEQAKLMARFADVVLGCRPRLFVMENVARAQLVNLPEGSAPVRAGGVRPHRSYPGREPLRRPTAPAPLDLGRPSRGGR